MENWVPKTQLGRRVFEGQISSIHEVFSEGQRIKEVEIVDLLVPDLKDEVIHISLVQKQTDSGESSRFTALVAVGNGSGLIGVGLGKAQRVRNAIEKGIRLAKLNLHPVRMGCGSWECDCGEGHTLPFKVRGKAGSVVVTLLPAPRGLGLVVGDTAKVVLRLAGVKDCWSKSIGQTATRTSFAFATFEALKQTTSVMTPQDWA
ncbi:30S ribosomal protein S5 [Candidatus Bathyarchaeota archaeon RBG_16_57_9]|nr:MAG: 30S ribosomal protein S5 [Candidatus Bathyarchaeota archaeon RBG_16_57_9]OGD54115.1 MAG: 30S ribosomal protein S5 [Candidatus Bathyarchaeota archaeon RBG_13_60_20]